MAPTERPGSDEYAPFYAGYVARVPPGDLVEILRRQIGDTAALLRRLAARADFAYEPGKWTVKEVVAHLNDTERVFAYRMLRVGRGDPTPLPGFDEKAYAPASAAGARTLEDLVAELLTVRSATVSLLAGLPAGAWARRGTASGATISVRAMASITAGHELHHRAILEERYLAAPAGGG